MAATIFTHCRSHGAVFGMQLQLEPLGRSLETACSRNPVVQSAPHTWTHTFVQKIVFIDCRLALGFCVPHRHFPCARGLGFHVDERPVGTRNWHRIIRRGKCAVGLGRIQELRLRNTLMVVSVIQDILTDGRIPRVARGDMSRIQSKIGATVVNQTRVHE